MPANELRHNQLREPEMVTRWSAVLEAVRRADTAMFSNPAYQQVGHEALQEMQPNPVPVATPAEQAANVNTPVKVPAAVMPQQPEVQQPVAPMQEVVEVPDEIRRAVDQAFEESMGASSNV